MDTVTELPVLSEAVLGPLPTGLPDGAALLAYQTQWNSAEHETIVSALATACIRAGRWQSIQEDVLFDLLQQYPIFRIDLDKCLMALADLIRDKEVHLVQYRDERYFVPTQVLAEKVRASPLTHYPAPV